LLKGILLAAAIALGLVVVGLSTYNYFFYRPGPASPSDVRGETAVLTSPNVLVFSQGAFLDKRHQIHREAVAPALGYVAPDFELHDLTGNTVSLQSLRGKPVLLNFWSTWCPPCRKEMPDLQAFHATHGAKIHLVGINWGEELGEIKSFLNEYGVTYLNVIDENGKLFVLYQLSGLPTSYFLDEDGIIRGIWLGAMTAQDIVAAFEKTTRTLEEPK
jgi:thiol-disulfide isomerase/thioredoxin